MVLPLIGLGMAGLGIAKEVGGFVAGRQQASATNAYNRAVAQVQDNYRRELMHFQNGVWEQDLEYAYEVLEYSRDEFSKQEAWAGQAIEAVTRNRDAETFTLLVRGIEENIAATMATQAVQRQGRSERASYRARDRGVEGNTVEAVVGDVLRQEGEAITTVELNRDASRRQLTREALAIDAGADQQISQIANSIRTIAPQAPIRAPSPVQPTAPAQTVNGPSVFGLLGGVAQAAASGLNSYSQFTGQTNKQTVDQLGAWVRRQIAF